MPTKKKVAATVHGWYYIGDTEFHVLQKDGEWYIIKATDHLKKLPEPRSLHEAAVALFERSRDPHTPTGWLHGQKDGEQFDEVYGKKLKGQFS